MAEDKKKPEKKVSKLVIDAEGSVMGRIASFVAKQALFGKEIIVVNSDKAIITGTKKNILANYVQKRARGGYSQKGPYFPTIPELIMKRTIRNMLAFRQVRCERACSLIRDDNRGPEEDKKDKKEEK